MRELSESVYFWSRDRSTGVRWLEQVGIVGYVLRPRGHWVQVFPGWDADNHKRKEQALEHSSGPVLHYFYDTDEKWSAAFYYDGEKLSSYRCDFETPRCDLQGTVPKLVAEELGVSHGDLMELLDEEIAEGWMVRADRAAELAQLLSLPNYAYASYQYAKMDAEVTGMSDLYVDLPDDDNEEADEPTDDEVREAGQDSSHPSKPPAPEPKQKGDGNAPWQQAYELASQFLKRLHDEEYIELTFDSRLVRDRLIERLTKTVIENPISNDAQLVAFWLDNLMEAPEIVDVFATDEMLLEAFRDAMTIAMSDESS